jgi:hypothetical protein
MALEAVYRNRRVIVAAPAEMLGAFIADRLPIAAIDSMTADAFADAELPATHTLVHGIVALMLHHRHVIAPHVVRIGHAVLAASLGQMRQQIVFGLRGAPREGGEE